MPCYHNVWPMQCIHKLQPYAFFEVFLHMYHVHVTSDEMFGCHLAVVVSGLIATVSDFHTQPVMRNRFGVDMTSASQFVFLFSTFDVCCYFFLILLVFFRVLSNEKEIEINNEYTNFFSVFYSLETSKQRITTAARKKEKCEPSDRNFVINCDVMYLERSGEEIIKNKTHNQKTTTKSEKKTQKEMKSGMCVCVFRETVRVEMKIDRNTQLQIFICTFLSLPFRIRRITCSWITHNPFLTIVEIARVFFFTKSRSFFRRIQFHFKCKCEFLGFKFTFSGRNQNLAALPTERQMPYFFCPSNNLNFSRHLPCALGLCCSFNATVERLQAKRNEKNNRRKLRANFAIEK